MIKLPSTSSEAPKLSVIRRFLTGFTPKSLTVAIDFSNGWIKIAQAETKAGHISLVYITAAPFPVDVEGKNQVSNKEFKKLVWDMLRFNPKNVISCLPRHLVTIRFLKLPSINEIEIAKMLEFQATRQLPFSKEDVVTGYKIFDLDKDGYSRVMLVIAQKNILDNHFAMLKEAGISPRLVYLST